MPLSSSPDPEPEGRGPVATRIVTDRRSRTAGVTERPLGRPGRRHEDAPRHRSTDRVGVAVTTAVDVLVVPALFAVTATFGWGVPSAPGIGATGPLSAPALAMALAAPFALALVGSAARPARLGALRRSLGSLLVAVGLCLWVGIGVAVAADGDPRLGQLLAVSLLLGPAWFVGRRLVDRITPRLPDRVVVLGTGRIAARIVELAQRDHGRSFRIVGCLDDDPLPMPEGAAPLLGGVDALPRMLATGEVDRVIVSFSTRTDADTLEILRECDAFQVPVDVVPRMFDLLGPRVQAYDIGGLPVLSVDATRHTSPGRGIAKRALDIAGAAAALLVLSPVMAVVAAAIMLDTGRPFLYRQIRIGRRGRTFSIVKFRTMVRDAEAIALAAAAEVRGGEMAIQQAIRQLKREDDPRITAVGRFLRRTSLDELPQFWNVLVGQMSLVGPRPLCDWEVDSLEPWQSSRQHVRPGITGLWQVAGRSKIHWDERMQLDYSYVRHWSLGDDLDILIRTLPSVLQRRGAI